jgi:hypothetical protein
MGHYYGEMHYEGEDEDDRRIEEKYARMSWEEIRKLKRDMIKSVFEKEKK